MVEESALPGNTLSSTARKYSISASLLFTWRRLMEQGGLAAMGSGEDVAPISEVKNLKTRIRELERLLGKKTMEVEILKEAIELTRKKNDSCETTPRKGSLPHEKCVRCVGCIPFCAV
jgi:transposase